MLRSELTLNESWHTGSRVTVSEMYGDGISHNSHCIRSEWLLRPGELCVDRLLPVLRTVGLGDGRDPGSVCNGGVHGPLGRAHVGEGGVQAGALVCCVAVVGVGSLVL